MFCVFRTKANRVGRMPIISAVDDDNQIIHITIDTQSTDEEYYKNMSDLTSIISKFDKPKLLVDNTDSTENLKQNSLKRLQTFNLENIKYLEKIAIFGPWESNILHKILEFCITQNTLCRNFNDIEQAREWLKAE